MESFIAHDKGLASDGNDLLPGTGNEDFFTLVDLQRNGKSNARGGSASTSSSLSSQYSEAFDRISAMDVERSTITAALGTERHKFTPEYDRLNSARIANPIVPYISTLRQKYPKHCVTAVAEGSAPLLDFARAENHASAKLDIETESVYRYRIVRSGIKEDDPVKLGEGLGMGKYLYVWNGQEFVIYKVQIGLSTILFVLKEPDVDRGETTLSTNLKTDMLIEACARWAKPDNEYIYVFDGYWSRNKGLWEEVQKSRWRDVILDNEMKEALTSITEKFFDSRDVYKDLGVPWKRGIIFHGPPGNGKTVSIKALMNQISEKFKGEENVSLLYVRSASNTYQIGSVFSMARQLSPCLLVLEDIDSIVNPSTRSYFFNEVDGLENNDGIMMVASTNYLDKLDPGLSKRPSRFDRKYYFPTPREDERTQYCEYWRKKLADKPSVVFPQKLCPAIARITDGFSFAYLKEAFVATLLVIAGRKQDDSTRGNTLDDNDDDLEKYELWTEMKKQVKILKDDMGSSGASQQYGGLNFPVVLPTHAPVPQVAPLAMAPPTMTKVAMSPPPTRNPGTSILPMFEDNIRDRPLNRLPAPAGLAQFNARDSLFGSGGGAGAQNHGWGPGQSQV